MPTYDYQCPHCQERLSVVQSISSYAENPRRPVCPVHGPMERRLSVVPSSGLANALAGDRHYEGLRAPDGSDISSRSKHREYMKRTGLTTADDFKSSWSQSVKDRETYRAGAHTDKELRTTIAEQVYKTV